MRETVTLSYFSFFVRHCANLNDMKMNNWNTGEEDLSVLQEPLLWPTYLHQVTIAPGVK